MDQNQDVVTLDKLDGLAVPPSLYGVLGYPIAHSLSPAFQQAGFDALKIPAIYRRFEIPAENLPVAVAKLKERGASGWNCTLPHKIGMAELVDELTDSARSLQSVNTVLNDRGRLVGFNTDGEGWLKAIRHEFGAEIRDLRVMILGAGGAGRGLARQAAIERCARLVLVNRTFDRARELARQLGPLMLTNQLLGPRERLLAIPWEENLIADQINDIDLVVNATSLGLKPYDPPVLPARVLQAHLLVFDTIYRPAKTGLMLEAEKVGARVANGASMLLYQGAASFGIWTGREAPLDVMREALRKAMESV